MYSWSLEGSYLDSEKKKTSRTYDSLVVTRSAYTHTRDSRFAVVVRVYCSVMSTITYGFHSHGTKMEGSQIVLKDCHVFSGLVVEALLYVKR